jgi:hypothetical protein
VNVFRFEGPVHYIVEEDQRTQSGELVSRMDTLVLRYGDDPRAIHYCTSCLSRECHHVKRVRTQETADLPDDPTKRRD